MISHIYSLLFHTFPRINPPYNIHHLHTFQDVGRYDLAGGAGKDIDYVTDHEVVVLGGAFVRAIIIAGVGRGQFRHLIILDMAIFYLIHILTADFHAAILSHDQHAAFQILVPYRRRVAQTAHSTVHEIKIHETGILKGGQFLVVEVGETGLDITDIPK